LALGQLTISYLQAQFILLVLAGLGFQQLELVQILRPQRMIQIFGGMQMMEV
jgi:hypothetical protein